MTAKKTPEPRTYSFWVVARRSPDVEGEWEAHCLELDVVSQGRSLHHAFEMAAEAVSMTLASDLVAGRDPMERRAPQEFWDRLWRLLSGARPITRSKAFADDSKIGVLVGQLQFAVAATRVAKKAARRKTSQTPKWKLPAAWSQQASAA